MFAAMPALPWRILSYTLLIAVVFSLTSFRTYADASSDTTEVAAASGIVVSVHADRTGAQPIEHVALSGEVFVFIDGARNVRRAAYYLNDPLAQDSAFRTSANHPFDLEGTSGGLALPFDTTTLDDGTYTLTAVQDYANNRVLAVHGTITVRNDSNSGTTPGPTPQPDVEAGPRPVEPTDCDVWVSSGEDARAVVSAQPVGATICFEAGVHRLSGRMAPRDGQSLVGEAGAVLSGAKVVDGWVRDGDRWYADGQTQRLSVHGEGRCRSDYPRCHRAENVFVDGDWLRHVDTLDDLDADAYFFDYDNDRIWLGADPTGHTIEATITDYAIRSSDDDVTIAGLTIQHFGPHAQHGAIHIQGNRWSVTDNVVRANHGVGIRTMGSDLTDVEIRHNRVTHQGQLGVGGHGIDLLVEANEIAYSNQAGFNPGWEAGGTKWVRTQRLVVRGNHVHHNIGPGLWTDIDNIHTLYEHNLTEHNDREGIFHEISYDAVIRTNTVRGNGHPDVRWGYGAGILIAHSPNVTVHHNTVTDNARGIVGIQQDRGTGRHGPYELENLHVHDNTITMTTGYTGIQQDISDRTYFTDRNNRFETNTYHLDNIDNRRFHWQNSRQGRHDWIGFGNDPDGTYLSVHN